MATERVHILEPATGSVVGRCDGPTATGGCPRPRRDGVVACAGRLLVPQNADPRYWPMWMPPSLRRCPLLWSRQAEVWLRRAEATREQRRDGQQKEIAYAKMRAGAGDKRFRNMTQDALELVGRARWSRSSYAKRLAELEIRYRRRAQPYLEFAEWHRYRSPVERERLHK
jgi:hypothetical protein